MNFTLEGVKAHFRKSGLFDYYFLIISPACGVRKVLFNRLRLIFSFPFFYFYPFDVIY